MIIYIALLFITAIGCCYSHGFPKREHKILIMLICIMGLLCAFRGLYCGTDNINYKRIFLEKINSREYEILFGWTLNALPTFRIWMVSYAVLTYALLYYVIRKEVSYCCLSILIFIISPSRFFPETFNIVRQALAAVLIIIGFSAWKENQKIVSIGTIIIASLFHTSSLIALPFLLLDKIKISRTKTIIILLSTIVLGFLGSYSTGIREMVMSDTFTKGIGFESLDVVTAHYSNYGGKIGTLNVMGIFMRIVPLSFLCYLCTPQSRKESKDNNFYFNIFLISTAVNNIIVPSMSSGIRFMFSIQMVQILAIPIAYQYAKSNRRIVFAISFIVLGLLFIYYLSSLRTVGIRPIVPYEFSLES